MKITTTNNRVQNIQHQGYIEFQYGTVKQLSDLTTEILFSGEKITALQLEKVCACTIANVEKVNDNLWRGEVKYDAKHTGTFSKPVNIHYTEAGQKKSTQIKLKGLVQ